MSVAVQRSKKVDFEAKVRRLADVQPEALNWLWPNRLPCGKFTLMVGDPGSGKSFVALDIAARITRGTDWPDGSPAPGAGSVLLLNGEDGLGDTVIPRLTALGADLSRVHVFEGVRSTDGDQETSFALARHLEPLEWALVGMDNPRLLILDPISSFLRGINSNGNAVVRQLLAKLSKLAEHWNIGVLAITHFAKKYREYTLQGALGSMAFVAAARGVWLVARDPRDETRQLLLPMKSNLGGRAPGLGFRLHSEVGEMFPAVNWDTEPVNLQAEELVKLTRNAERPRRKTPREEAAECVRELLADGPRLCNAVINDAQERGFAERTIRRALHEIGVQTGRTEMSDRYYYFPGQEKALPEEHPWLWLHKREKEREEVKEI